MILIRGADFRVAFHTQDPAKIFHQKYLRLRLFWVIRAAILHNFRITLVRDNEINFQFSRHLLNFKVRLGVHSKSVGLANSTDSEEAD